MATFKSTQYTSQTDGSGARGADVAAKLRVARWSYTHTGANGTHTIQLLKLPAGRIKVYADLSRLVTSQFAATAVMDLGYEAYVDQAGATQAAALTAFGSDVAVGGSTIDAAFTLPAAGVQEFDSRDGVVLVATVQTANIEANDTLDGWVAFSQGN